MKFDFCASGDDPKCGFIKKCMSHSKWCPYVPMLVGAVLFVLGIILSAAFLKALWLLISILIILVGVYCYICMSNMSKKSAPKDTNKPEE